MNKKITTTEIYDKDKEWLRKLKIRNKIKGIKDMIHLIRKMITKHKLEGELI